MPAAVHTFNSLGSTNATAAELGAAGAPHGEIVRAYSQSAGRGRLGKKWCSPAHRGLYFSVIVRPRLAVEDYPKLTMVAGVALAAELQKLCGVEVMLKWPNDIIVNRKKCAGILCEAHLGPAGGGKGFGVVGIGLNVTTTREDFPVKLRADSTSLLLATGVEYDADELLRPLTEAVLAHVIRLEEEGFAPLLGQWQKRDYLKGRWLTWLTHGGETVFARAEGPDEHGNLLVRDERGAVHRVLSGDISLARKSSGTAED